MSGPHAAPDAVGEDPRVQSALHTLSSLQGVVAECELRVQRKEVELGDRLAELEGRLLEDVQRAVLEQRGKFRLAIRGVLEAIGEEEERRLALEAAQEIRMKEAEAVWREQIIHTHRTLAAAVGELTATASERAERAEARMMREVDALEPGTQRLEAVTKAAEERISTMSSETAAAVEALRAKHKAYDASLADARRDLEQTSASLTAQVEDLERRLEQATSGVDGAALRADDLLLQLQAATEREMERAVGMVSEARATATAHASADAGRLSAAATQLHAAAAMVAELRPGPGADLAGHAAGLSRLAMGMAAADGVWGESEESDAVGLVGGGVPTPPAEVNTGSQRSRPARIAAVAAASPRMSRAEAEEERELMQRCASSVRTAEAAARTAADAIASAAPLEKALAAQRAEASRSAQKTASLLENLEEETTQLRFQAAAFLDALPELKSLGSLPVKLGQVVLQMRDRVSDWEAHAARLRAELKEELEAHGRTARELERESMARSEVEDRIHWLAFERRARQSYVADPADEIDASFGAAVHAASLPLRIDAERLAKGSYKMHAASGDSRRVRGMTRRVGVLLSPNGIALVRMGAGVLPVAEFLHSLCADTLSRSMLPEEDPPSTPPAGWWDGRASALSHTGSRGDSAASSPHPTRRSATEASPAGSAHGSGSHNRAAAGIAAAGARAVNPSKLRPGAPPTSPHLASPYADARDPNKRRSIPIHMEAAHIGPTHMGRPVHSVSLLREQTSTLYCPVYPVYPAQAGSGAGQVVPVAAVTLDDLDAMSDAEDSPMQPMV
jgi:hypothetical protein